MRKEKDVTITDEGRDRGKTFKIIEMPAAQAEAWAVRAVLAICRANNGAVPNNMIGAGWAGLTVMTIASVLTMNYDDAKPLLDEMMACVKSVQPLGVRDLLPSGDDIEEVQTRLKLRTEVFALHSDFSIADFRSKLIQMVEKSAKEDSLSTETSDKPSE